MRRSLAALLFGLLAFSASIALAQTTGEITGRVTDEQGGALPGVTVEARSDALQGARTAVTDSRGAFFLVLLPPGAYKVTATLPGFARVEQTVVVALAKTATLDVRLQAAVAEAVVVIGSPPVVDTTSAAIQTSFDSRQIQTLPTGRNYTSVVLNTPGITTQSSNTDTFSNAIAVYGSSGLENSFIIDGVDTTGVEYGNQGKQLNFEFIQEVDVKAGGYQAEFGRSTGAIINVVTKSGGNEFHGDVFGYYTSGGLQAENRHPDENLYGTNLGYTRWDAGLDLGGYFLKDRLWFFGAYDRVEGTTSNALTSGPNEGLVVESNTEANLGSAKLTWMIGPSHSLVGSFFQDPRQDSGAINDGPHNLNGSLSTFLGLQDFGGQDWAGRYNGLFGSSWVASAQFALHQESNSVSPATEEGTQIQYIDSRPGAGLVRSGGFGLVQTKDFERYFWGGSVTKYWGGHEFKAGFEYEKQDATVTKRMSGGLPGGQQVRIIENPGHPSQPIYRHFYWTTPDASLPDNVPTSQLNATPAHRMYSAYLQDSWAVLPNLSVNLGVRWDQQQIIDSSGVQQINLNEDFAPRIGVIWDPTKDNKTKIYGSWGYFYEQIPMDLVIRSYSYERQPVIYNFDPTSIVPDLDAALICCTEDDPGAVDGGGGKILGGFTEPSDPNIKGQYIQEFLVGAEREFVPNLAVGVRYIYRDLGRVIEDFLCAEDFTYCIGNPGKGVWETGGQQYTFQEIFNLAIEQSFPAPEPKRTYHGVQLDVTKRFSDNWSLVASYLWSKLEGNYDGGFAPYTQPPGTADPNITASYDYFDFFTNGGDLSQITNVGYLSNDRRSQIKLYGIYVAPFKLQVGLGGYYRTGTPFTRLGYSGAYERWEFFLTERGGDGRVPSDYEMDLHLGYPLQIGPVTINAMVDIFQLLNVQRANFLDEAYNIDEFENPNYICGSDPTNVDEPKCNAVPHVGKGGYGTALARTQPRAFRFGLKISF